MNKKKITIIVIAIIIALAAVCGAVFGVRYHRQKEIDQKLNQGTATIEAYVEKFDAASDKAEKAQIYGDFLKDSGLKDIIATIATEEWNKNYKADKDTMYAWFVTYYSDKLDSVTAAYESTDKVFADCNKAAEDLNSLQGEINADTVLSKDDISGLSEELTAGLDSVNGDLEQIRTAYTDQYNSYLLEDADSASKSDLNTAIDSLNALSTELSDMSEDFFSELLGNIADTVSDYSSRVEEIEKEEAEKAKATEEAKKQQAASNSTGSGSSSSSSSSSDSSTSASTTASDWGQSTWTLTGRNDNGEVCNAPVEMYKAKAQGKAGGWTADGEYCLWSAEGEDIGYRCDKNGNVIETF
ncbi:MAG: hypothetical protein PUE83_11260 [Lachnobacterium sp.]|nr:hypothetical protein [Lachnobacterium sp.]